jgi:hypothetical protein
MTCSAKPYPEYTPTISFLDLPRELRDLCYDFAFRDSGEVQFLERDLGFRVRYRIQHDDKIEDAKFRAEESEDEILDADTLLPILSDDEDEDDSEGAEAGQREAANVDAEEEEDIERVGTEVYGAEDSDAEEDLVDNDESISDIATATRDEVLYQTSFGPPKADLRWLLTNRQILSEAVEQFYRHAHCTFYGNFKHSWNHEDHVTEQSAPKTAQIVKPISIFTFAKITSISLSLRLGTEMEQVDGEWYERLVPRRSEKTLFDDLDLSEILQHVRALNGHSLNHLDLNVWILQSDPLDWDDAINATLEVEMGRFHESLSGYQDVNGYEVDLSFLQSFGTKFKHIEITLFPTYMKAGFDDYGVEGSFVVVPMVQKELARMAKVLVGTEGWTIRDWTSETVTGQPWRLDVTKGIPGQQDGTLEHIGLKTWPGQDFDGDNDKFYLQEDRGDGVLTWVGSYSDNEVVIEVPIIRAELGDHLFQRTSVSLNDH